MIWITYLNTNIDHLVFELGVQHILARYKNHATSKFSFITLAVYAKAMAEVKLKGASAIEKLIFEFQNCFPFHELMNALGVVYSQYWLGLNLKLLFNCTLM
jgi:hypothetical protein